MHYFVDGYNLLFRLAGSHGKSLQILRQQVIFDLNEMVLALNLNLTLVFDSPNQQKERSRSFYHTLEILYTNHGETADELILSELKERKVGKEIVVTSDKLLAFQARRLHAKTESVEEFVEWINQRYLNKQKENTKSKIQPQARTIKEPEMPIIEKQHPVMEGTQEFYLKHFEEQYQKSLEEEKAKNPQKLSNKKKIQKYTRLPTDPYLEIDRWLEIFEERYKHLDEDSL